MYDTPNDSNFDINTIISNKLIQNLNITIPVDIVNVIEHLTDVKLHIDPNLDTSSKIERNQYGWVITIKNQNIDSPKTRFEIALNLSAIFLGLDEDNKDLDAFIADLAGKIMLPKSQFINIAYENSDNSICNCEKVAKIANVNTNVVKARGKYLGLFN